MINPKKAYTVDEYIEILRRRIWYIVVPFIVIIIGTSIYAIYAPRQYKASTLILVSPQKIPEAFVQPTVTSNVEDRLQSIAQEVLSRTRLERILDELNLYEKERKTLSHEEVVALMQKDIKIELPNSQQRGSFGITYRGLDPNVVAMVANRLASQFIEENLKLREQQAVGTTEFLTTELSAAKIKLDHMETAIKNYKMRFMGELPEQRETNIKILEQLQNQYRQVGETLQADQDRKLIIQKQLTDLELAIGAQGTASREKEGPSSSGKPYDLQNDKTSPLTVEEAEGYYESQWESLTRTLQEQRMRYTENHPDVIMTKKKLADMETKKVTKNRTEKKETKEAYNINRDPRYKELTNQMSITNLEIKRLSTEEPKIMSQINKYRARIEQAPNREQEMSSLLREYQSTKEEYGLLLKKSQDAQQAENLEKRQKGEQFRVIDPARVPEKPFSPDIPKILLLGLLAGLGCGIGLAFFREQLDRSFHDAGDAEITLGLKVLATIPKIERNEA